MKNLAVCTVDFRKVAPGESRHVHTNNEVIMKQQERKITVGVDVSKNRLDVFELETHEAYSIPQ